MLWTRHSPYAIKSGVALALVEPFPKLAVSGATRWLPDNRPLIQLSAAHETNDHLWHTFFHEAAHILLHSKEHVFIDTMKDQIAGVDRRSRPLGIRFSDSPPRMG